jgi:hypothetical protein
MAANQLKFPTQEKQMATLYARIRDAANYDCTCSVAERIAVLELVKSELVRDCQRQIDDGA